MKKRYLSMLMAVVLCLTLGTGTFAASGEVETAASEEITEPVADGQPSETPAESAGSGETPQTQALDGEGAGDAITYDYVGFDLVAWVVKDLTYDETEGYSWDEERLPGVTFGVFADADCETLIKEFTTDKNGTVTIDPGQFPAKCLSSLNADAVTMFYLKQTGAQDTEHGKRPMADVMWSIEAKAERGTSGDVDVSIRLDLPRSVNDGNDVGKNRDDGKFWVENERYVSLSFDLVKQVVKTDKNASLGENRFDFAIVPCTFGLSALAYPELVFTPEGGSSVTLSDYTVMEIDDDLERVYQVSLTVEDEGTAKATVTMQGWWSELRALEVYEIGDAPQGWEYADCMYMLQPRETELTIWCVPESTEGYHVGYAGKTYNKQLSKLKDAVVFTNSCTKLAPAPTATPAPTPTPTATPAPAKAVKTGDEVNLALWLALAAASALGLGYVCMKKKEN